MLVVGVRAARAEMWDGRNGRVLIKIWQLRKKILPLLRVKNILYRENEYRAKTSIK